MRGFMSGKVIQSFAAEMWLSSHREQLNYLTVAMQDDEGNAG